MSKLTPQTIAMALYDGSYDPSQGSGLTGNQVREIEGLDLLRLVPPTDSEKTDSAKVASTKILI